MRVISRPILSGRAVQPEALSLNVEIGDEVMVGKEGDLPAGVDPEDGGISRHALTITATPDGWKIVYCNRNRASEHRWAQPPVWRQAGTNDVLFWPRIGIRLVGSRADAQHWILLEADGYRAGERSMSSLTAQTDTVVPPLPLTRPQLDAVQRVFAEQLAWPPVSSPTTHALKAVANRLGISASGVTARLNEVRERAYKLGSQQQFSLTEPDYVFVLALHGYLPCPDIHVDATQVE